MKSLPPIPIRVPNSVPKALEKTYNNGQWTNARFMSFIKSGLRSLSQKWPPKWQVLKEARIERGIYKCAGYKKRSHKTTKSIVYNGKRANNIFVDHIIPVIGKEGFTSWDNVIKRMFVEISGLQVLCKDCHDRKSKEERNK